MSEIGAVARDGLAKGRGGGLLGGHPESRRHGLLRVHGLRLRNSKARVRRRAEVLGLAERLLGGTEGRAGRGRIAVVSLRLRSGGKALLASKVRRGRVCPSVLLLGGLGWFGLGRRKMMSY